MLRVVSACNTREAFVSAFGRYCDGQVILVATPDARGTGEELSFTITLASGLPLIIATGRVEKRFADGEGPLGRAGLFIRFVEVAPASRALLAELAAQPSEAGPVGRSGEPRQATDPSDIPELLDTRDTIPVGPSRVIVPKPPFAMTIKPDATPPPAFGDARAGTVRGEDEGPTGVKSMRAVIMSRTRQPAAHGGDDFGDEASWDDGKHGSFGDAGGPGSRTALRAEPAGRLDGAELAALMACTVYEESGLCDERGLPIAATAAVFGDDDAWGDDPTLPPWLRGPVADMDGAGADADVDAAGEIPEVAERREPAPPQTVSPSRLHSHSVSKSSAVSLAGAFEREPAAVAAPPGAAPRPAPASPREGRPREARARNAAPRDAGVRDAGAREDRVVSRSRARWRLVVGAAIAGSVVGMVAGYAIGAAGIGALRGTDDARVLTGPAGVVMARPAPPAPPPVDPAVAAGGLAVNTGGEGRGDGEEGAATKDDDGAGGRGGEADGSAPGAEPAAAAALAPDRCALQVESDPSGSDVAVGGEVMGATPARLELPCGVHEIDVNHSRYQPVQRRVRLRPGRLERVDLRLERPDHKLRIVSAPLGASVTVNGRPIGVTPVVTPVKGYQHVKVRIERPGFETWVHRVYARDPLTRVTVKLAPDRTPPPGGRPAADGQEATPPAHTAPPPAPGPQGSGGR